MFHFPFTIYHLSFARNQAWRKVGYFLHAIDLEGTTQASRRMANEKEKMAIENGNDKWKMINDKWKMKFDPAFQNFCVGLITMGATHA
jgi:hypothetical protein